MVNTSTVLDLQIIVFLSDTAENLQRVIEEHTESLKVCLKTNMKKTTSMIGNQWVG